MARGTIGKSEVVKRIQQAFGADYIGEVDRKVYIWANDGGERVQIAITLTCPKNFVDVPNTTPVEKKEDFDWGMDPGGTKLPTSTKAKMTQEEIDRINTLMEKLGL